MNGSRNSSAVVLKKFPKRNMKFSGFIIMASAGLERQLLKLITNMVRLSGASAQISNNVRSAVLKSVQGNRVQIMSIEL